MLQSLKLLTSREEGSQIIVSCQREWKLRFDLLLSQRRGRPGFHLLSKRRGRLSFHLLLSFRVDEMEPRHSSLTSTVYSHKALHTLYS